jgi:C-terminal processing protease CtpA/Prc
MTRRTKFFGFGLLPFAALFVMTGRAADVEPLTKEYKTETIDSLASALKENYIFPETAAKVDADLHARLKRGEYDAIAEGPDFAKLISEHMNALCKDAHLRVRFSKEDLPKRAERTQPSKEEIQQEQRRIRLMNGGINSVERLVGNVGYIDTTGFMDPNFAKRPIDAAMQLVENTDALIIDMRWNGGGHPATVQYLCSYLFGPKKVHLNDIEFRGQPKREFWTLGRLPGKRYVGKDVYVLCGKRTASGAEEFCYDLKNLKRATVIGESTWGGANPGGTVRINDHFAAFIPSGRAVNPYTGTNWEGTGVEPDIKIAAAEALKTAHVMAVKKLLEQATDPQDKERLTEALAAAEKGQLK